MRLSCAIGVYWLIFSGGFVTIKTEQCRKKIGAEGQIPFG